MRGTLRNADHGVAPDAERRTAADSSRRRRPRTRRGSAMPARPDCVSCAPSCPSASRFLRQRTASSTSSPTSITGAATRCSHGRRRRTGSPAGCAACRTPTEQRQTVESRCGAAQPGWSRRARQAAEQLGALNVELRDAEQTIAGHGHLPRPGLAAQEARTLLAQEKRLRDEASTSLRQVEPAADRSCANSETRSSASRLHRDGARRSAARVAELDPELEPIARRARHAPAADRTRSRAALEESLVARCGSLSPGSSLRAIASGYHALAMVSSSAIEPRPSRARRPAPSRRCAPERDGNTRAAAGDRGAARPRSPKR